MGMEFRNVYQDARRAESYSRLEFPGTYYLAFRDLPRMLTTRAKDSRALDFGCGAGRSTRFLRGLGFETVGVDISAEMIGCAKRIDPTGDYRLVKEGDMSILRSEAFGLVFSAFTFDNIPTAEMKAACLGEIARILRTDGVFVNLVSSPEIYKHEWASFSTKDFSENKTARTGDLVRIIQKDVEDRRPVEDVIWYDEDYQTLYRRAGLRSVDTLRPLGRPNEPYAWINEMRIAPWTIYVMEKG